MRKYITKSLILIKFSTLPFLFIGCGDEKQTSKTQKGSIVLGQATSISMESNSEILPSADTLNQKIGEVIKTHLSAINDKEATVLSKETLYCEIDGLKEIENSDDTSDHSSAISFCDCQDEEIFQNGILEVSYNQADDDGKYPTEVTLKAHGAYHFNEMSFSNDTTITVKDIKYIDGKIQSLIAMTSGKVTVDTNQTLNLQNFNHSIIF